MSDRNDTNRRNSISDDEENSNSSFSWIGTAAGITAAVVAGGLLWATRSSPAQNTSNASSNNNQPSNASSKNNQSSNASSKNNQPSNASSKNNQSSNASSNNNQSSNASSKNNQPSNASSKNNQSSNASSKHNQPSNASSKNKSSNVSVTETDFVIVKKPSQAKAKQNQSSGSASSPTLPSQSSSLASGILNILSAFTKMGSSQSSPYDKVASSPPPVDPCITNLNGLLHDIYVRFVQIKNDDFYKHYSVFDQFFQKLQVLMKEVDPYYNKYSSMKQFAGSHYDNLRIKSADEFDMDIVINLCLDLKENRLNPAASDIVIQHQAPGFVQLKMGTQYQNLPMRDGDEWQINKTAYKWKDDACYLLRSKFLDWFKSVVNRALDKLPSTTIYNLPTMCINGRNYVIKKSESGPSMTLFIENPDIGFKLDVDLVPALKFPEERWPISKVYRGIPIECRKGYWMVVGKPNKNGSSSEQARSWRIALHYQERDLIHNLYNLKPTLRTMKCLRDAQGMKKIASYYIKTLFLWEVTVQTKDFWQKSPAFLFQHMVKKLYDALVKKEIPYFWNRNNNMLHHIDGGILRSYALLLEPLLAILEDQGGDRYKHVAKYLLTKPQFAEYNKRYLHLN